MPQLVIQTNLRLSQIPANFNETTTELLASIQNKPSSMTLVSVLPNQLVTFGGTNEPCALIYYQSIGNISLEENRESCSKIFEHLEKELNISPERIFINYVNLDSSNVAWNRNIFADIFSRNDQEESKDEDLSTEPTEIDDQA